MFAKFMSVVVSGTVLASGLVLAGAPVSASPAPESRSSRTVAAVVAQESVHAARRRPKGDHPVFGSHPGKGHGHGHSHGQSQDESDPWGKHDWDDDWDDDWDSIDWDNIDFDDDGASDDDAADDVADDDTEVPEDDTTTPDAGGDGGKKVRLVQANIRTSLTDKRWFSDYRRVLRLKPDFITLNEANRRGDAVLAVNGYAIHRSLHSPYTAETPVLWRTDRWIRVGAGTRYLTTRRVKWGVRAVNWVTVRSRTSNRVVSVVSAHPAPSIPATRGLLGKFTRELGSLTDELAAQGPVFVGGDLNVGYQSSRWPAATLAGAGLQPTYAALGRPRRGTGDHGAIIDYLLYQPGRGVTATRQGTRRQNSDHHTVWADFTLRS